VRVDIALEQAPELGADLGEYALFQTAREHVGGVVLEREGVQRPASRLAVGALRGDLDTAHDGGDGGDGVGRVDLDGLRQILAGEHRALVARQAGVFGEGERVLADRRASKA